MSSLTKQQQDDIMHLLDEGFSVRSIPPILGISYGQARYFLEQKEQADAETIELDLPDVEAIKELSNELIEGVRPPVTYVWDIECTNLSADMGTLLVAAFLNMATGEVMVRNIQNFPGKIPERERALAAWTRRRIEEADLLVGQNSLAFDKNFVNGVLARQGMEFLPLRQHVDTYLIARYGLKGRLQSYGLANLADFFGVVAKGKVSKHDWRKANTLDEGSLSILTEYCVRDVAVTAQVFSQPQMRDAWHRWKGR